MRSALRAGCLTLALSALACAGEEDADAGAPVDDTPPVPAMAAGEATPPDTTAAGLWAHLQAADPAANWQLWPGRGRLYPGTDPHGALLTTYVNAMAYDALTSGAPDIPEGAIVVKENYTADSVLVATTVMFKTAPGYDPDNGDWFWLKRLADGTNEVAGRGEACRACHADAPGGDRFMTPLPGEGS